MMKNKTPLLFLLFFVALLVFLLLYSYKKLLIYHYQKTFTTEESTLFEVKEAIHGMTAAGNPAVPTLAQLLTTEKDHARSELILGALLRINTKAARQIARKYFDSHIEERFILQYWHSIPPSRRSRELLVMDAKKLQQLHTGGIDMSMVEIDCARIKMNGGIPAGIWQLHAYNNLILKNPTLPDKPDIKFLAAKGKLQAKPKTARLELLSLLECEELAVRQRAFDELMLQAGGRRGAYDPGKPAAVAVQAWREWINAQD
ncbi:hypothetical protein ACFL54_02725 [Planctomycetota bacterium]